jgi:hypothetical protein
MQFTPIKAAIAVAWLIGIGVVGALLPVTSVVGWATIVGFGLMPCILLLRAWRQPQQTISESIQAETRRR